MIWGPFLLALALGLIVSAGLYFAYLWPDAEPDDEALPVPGVEATAEVAPEPTATEAATEADAPASETSPA